MRWMERTYQILKDHVPADDKGDELSHGDIGVHVGRARGVWYPHPKLCVASSCNKQAHKFITRDNTN